MNIRGLHDYIEGRESFKCLVCGEFYDIDKRFFPVCCPYCAYGRSSSLLLEAEVKRALEHIEKGILKKIDVLIRINKETIEEYELTDNDLFNNIILSNKKVIATAEYCKKTIKRDFENYKSDFFLYYYE